jgi:oligopeptidase B
MAWSRLSHAWLLLAALALVACAPARAPVAPAPESASVERTLPPEPRAEQRPFTVVSPQGNREDPWFWLRDDSRTDPDVIAYLEAENAYFEAWESRYTGLVDRLYHELVGRIQQDDSTVPVYIRGFWYYTRFEEGRQYPIHARRKGSMDAPEQILLDGNAMAAGQPFFQIGGYSVSDDNRLLAWMEDTVGRRQYTLRVRDLETGEILLDGIERVSSFAWAADSRHLLYVENHPVTLLSYRVLRHDLGGGQPDVVVHEETDDSF